MIPEKRWRWFGHAGHLIVGNFCRFHLCTLIGKHLVSTVGEHVPDSPVREILADSRGIKLEGRGDARLADYMKKVGFEEIGAGRKYETMVFKVSRKVCDQPKCLCGLPEIIPTQLDFSGYNTAGEAADGHLKMCRKWAKR